MHVRKYSSIHRKQANFDVKPYKISQNEINENVVVHISSWHKLQIKQNLRTILIKQNDFILRETNSNKNFKIITKNQTQQQIYQQLTKEALICGRNIVKVIECIRIEYANGNVEFGIIGICPNKAQMDQNYKLLYVELFKPEQRVFHYFKIASIRYVVRAVHACIFKQEFYQSLYGHSKKMNNCCVADVNTYSMKHNEQNQKYWISPYVNSYVPLMYSWLLLQFPDCIKH